MSCPNNKCENYNVNSDECYDCGKIEGIDSTRETYHINITCRECLKKSEIEVEKQ